MSTVGKALKWTAIAVVALIILIVGAGFYYFWREVEIDVAELECRLSFRSNIQGAFKRHDGQLYLYLILRGNRSDPDHFDTLLQFERDNPEPKSTDRHYSGNVLVNPDTIQFATDDFTWTLACKTLELQITQEVVYGEPVNHDPFAPGPTIAEPAPNRFSKYVLGTVVKPQCYGPISHRVSGTGGRILRA